MSDFLLWIDNITHLKSFPALGSLEPVQDENLVDKAWDLLWVHKDVQNDFQAKFLT